MYTSSSSRSSVVRSFSRSRNISATSFSSISRGNLRRLSEADDARNVQRAGPHAALVAAAVDDRRQLHARIAPADVQRADAFGPVNLVGRERSEIDVIVIDVNGNLARRLNRVRMEQHARVRARSSRWL